MSPESPWTVEEAAAWLKRSPEYVRRLARSGRLPGEKEGRDWRFDPAVVRERIRFEPRKSELASTVEARLDVAAARLDLIRRRRTS